MTIDASAVRRSVDSKRYILDSSAEILSSSGPYPDLRKYLSSKKSSLVSQERIQWDSSNKILNRKKN